MYRIGNSVNKQKCATDGTRDLQVDKAAKSTCQQRIRNERKHAYKDCITFDSFVYFHGMAVMVAA